MIFYNEREAIKDCLNNPKLIFQLIKEGYIETVDKVLNKNNDLINTTDENGNNIMMKLLSKKYYNSVLNNMNNKKWDINHQNKDGNTFSHILVSLDYLKVAKIFEKIIKNKNLLINTKNKKNMTILDIAILNNQLCMATKILKDKRFYDIDILTFKNMYDKYINNTYYGKYSKLNNLEIIVNNLEKKNNLKPRMKTLLSLINNNIENIKEEINLNKSTNIDLIIESLV